MCDGFEIFQRAGIGEDFCAEGFAVNAAFADNTWETFGDGRQSFAAWTQEPVYDGIGIEDRNAQLFEQSRRGGFAHGDGAGEADDQRRALPAVA